MKKLLAILTSAFLLCAMIPFATAAAAADPAVELYIVDDLEEINAGEEFQVEVKLKNIPDPGLIAALVEIEFDSDVFELVTTFDEDEEAWFPPIEVGSKYNASSNKYIMFSPIDEETGAMERCLVKYVRALASASQTRKEEHFFTVTFKVKDDAVSGEYELNVKDSTQNFLLYGNVELPVQGGNAFICVNGSEPVCQHEYFTPCEQYCMNCGELTNPDAAHHIVHAAAKAATCTELGNIEHWYCDVCGMAWLNENCTQNTNLRAVKLPAFGHTYANAHDVTCDICGAEREIAASDIIIGDGNSTSEHKNGLAFKFDVAAKGIACNEEYIADYSNATVAIDGVDYKLIGMGAIVNNLGYANQTLDNVDGSSVKKVDAVKVFECSNDAASFAVRVINIPEKHLNSEITVRSYYIYETAEGEQITVYGEDYTTTYNAVLSK